MPSTPSITEEVCEEAGDGLDPFHVDKFTLVASCYAWIRAAGKVRPLKGDVSVGRVLTSLGAAAAAYEGVEDWAAASEAHHLTALVCHTARLLPQCSAAASAWQRTAARAKAAAAAQTPEGIW